MMDKKGILCLIASLIIFTFSVAAAGDLPGSSACSARATGRFLNGLKKADINQLDIKFDRELKFKVSSYVEKGSLIFTVISPDNNVVYEIKGKSFSDIQTIPVTKGIWTLKVDSDNAENGSYFISAAAY